MLGTRGQWSFQPGNGVSAVIHLPLSITFEPISKTLLISDFAEDMIMRVR